ncbi:lipopolysaccharide assembly protein LapA domain-containing protein [Thiovibrio sp. JS02]
MRLKKNLLIALFMVMLVFTLQNAEPVDIRFFFWQLTLSRALLLFVVLAVGCLCGFVLGTLRKSRPVSGPGDGQPPGGQEN